MKKFKFSAKNLTSFAGISLFVVILVAFSMLAPFLFPATILGAMIFTPSPLMGEMRKKAGSAVFSKNHYGGFVRKLVKPINPKSVAQSNVRAYLRNLAKDWKSLTQPQMIAWNTLASNRHKKNRLGQNITLTGEATFIALNLNILLAGGTQISDCPSLSLDNLSTLAGVSIAIASGAVTITYSGTLATGEKLEVRASGNISAGKFYNSKFKTMAYYSSSDTSPITATTVYTTLFGTPPSAGGVVIWEYRTVDTATGFASAYTKLRTVAS